MSVGILRLQLDLQCSFNSSILACQVIIAVVTVVIAGLDRVPGRFVVFHDRIFSVRQLV